MSTLSTVRLFGSHSQASLTIDAIHVSPFFSDFPSLFSINYIFTRSHLFAPTLSSLLPLLPSSQTFFFLFILLFKGFSYLNQIFLGLNLGKYLVLSCIKTKKQKQTSSLNFFFSFFFNWPKIFLFFKPTLKSYYFFLVKFNNLHQL